MTAGATDKQAKPNPFMEQDLLLFLAKSGRFSPLDFVIAAVNVPGFDKTKSKHFDAQIYGSDGFPISDEEYEQLLRKEESDGE